ncbi:hypothetical protein AY601_1993 [Pedobacter cryoconitis]|uniref:DUF4365 domain-containing protein n=1 Tax=Pedobacter cryoconitis TaxID=188932 RepID=A0A127VCE7_9SPHI|nr:hypothetical protein [Pedobacter cryoconitis]AMP98899.1 hypothetical protein AY601_1993 [Pedobacter cryoconitis]
MDLKYNNLHHLQVGRIGEYWIKLMLTMQGFDTYYSDVDNKAIDFVVRLDNSKHIDIQVKTIRLKKSSYVFVTKKSWAEHEMSRANLYLALVILKEDQYPESYLIPSSAWLRPDELFCDRKYQEKGLKSLDEWGLNISTKNMHLLDPYKLEKQVKILNQLSLTNT